MQNMQTTDVPVFELIEEKPVEKPKTAQGG